VNVTSDAAIELHRFLELGVELLHRQRQALTIEPTRFLFAPRSGGTALLGVLQAGIDSAGRQFPLAAFLEYSADRLPSSVAEIPFFAADALEAGQRFLADRASSPQPVDEALLGLAVPGPNAASSARQRWEQALALVRVADLQELFAAGPTVGGAWYAVKTAMMACEARRKTAGDAPTLECPLSPGFGPGAWLEIVSRGNPGAPHPTLLWNSSRLYVALGAPLPAIFMGLVGGVVHSTKVWPVGTTQQAAINSARASLRAAPLLANPEVSLLDALGDLGSSKR
jgi:type VI secretion system protein ImpM